MSTKEQRVRVLLRTPICFNGGLAFSPGDECEMDVADARRMFARALCERPQLRDRDGEAFDRLVASMTDQERARLADYNHSSLLTTPASALERMGLDASGRQKGGPLMQEKEDGTVERWVDKNKTREADLRRW